MLKSALMAATMLSVMKAGMIEMHRCLAMSLLILLEHSVSFNNRLHHCYINLVRMSAWSIAIVQLVSDPFKHNSNFKEAILLVV